MSEPAPTRPAHALEPYLPPVYALCFRLLRDPIAAEDAAQETFLQAIQIWDQFVAPEQPTGSGRDARLQWLLAIAAYRALRLRQAAHSAHRWVPFVEGSMESEADTTPSVAVERAELSVQLESALQALPEEERRAVILHHVAGLTQSAIARILDLPTRTVSHRISDGLSAMRARLERETPSNASGAPVPATGGRWSTLGLLLAKLPSPAAAPGMATRVFAHAQLVTWNGSANLPTAGPTASGAIEPSASHAQGVGDGAFSAPTKAVATHSRNMVLGVLAVALVAVLLFWFASVPPSVVPGKTGTAATPASLATPRREPTPERAAESPAGSALANSVKSGSVEASHATAVAPPPTATDPEAEYLKYLTPAQAALRAELAESYSAPILQSIDSPLFDGEQGVVETSIGWIEHTAKISGTDGWGLSTVRLVPFQPDKVKPFDWNTLVMHANGGVCGETGDWSTSNTEFEATTIGEATDKPVTLETPQRSLLNKLLFPNNHGMIVQGQAPTKTYLRHGDLWPAGMPARFDARSVLDRVGLAGEPTARLTDLLAKAQKADTAFLEALRAWLSARKSQDPAAIKQTALTAEKEYWALTIASAAFGEDLSNQLREQQSGVPGSAAFVVNRTLRQKVEKITSLTLVIQGRNLAAVALVINENPITGGTVAVAPELAQTIVQGTLTADSLPELIQKLAELAKVDCKDDGANAWKLTPQNAGTTAPNSGQGF